MASSGGDQPVTFDAPVTASNDGVGPVSRVAARSSRSNVPSGQQSTNRLARRAAAVQFQEEQERREGDRDLLGPESEKIENGQRAPDSGTRPPPQEDTAGGQHDAQRPGEPP